MTFAFIRHGQTDWNLHKRLQGATDIPLNETGRQQARDAVAGLAGGGWQAIVSSPLSRARETAQIIADGLGIELGPAYDELIERDYGEAEGVVEAEAEERWPGKTAPGIEPIDEVVRRGRAALDRIAEDYRDEDVLVVCHGTLIRYTLAELAGRELPAIVNGSVSTFGLEGERWRVLTVNDEPLEDLTPED
ncbi:histidine phosphatase family protein [Homoserinibacter sp. YIM 151385]|uniref:histidine phosphatase family protein n=1 Tax=Homoserinibacter sp. YIM 151385 TaxID=2985506 RepID=UPI0022F136F3|nr:histidine phosphatase family protein [Homoserinibacter sp. YIM 151385]WBU39188.1 histidine phosphatase family protein [Homoserinibacter sp. YIM 151385]